MKGEDTWEMVLWWGFFITLFFLPPCSFGSVKTKSVTVNCQAREAHMPISSSISSPCLHRAVVSLSVLGEIWLPRTCYSIRMLHFLAYSSSPPCCWMEIHVSSWARVCASNWQLWRWTMVIYWILTVRLRHYHTSWLEKQHAAPSPQTFQGNFRQTCRQEHRSWMLQTLHSIAPLLNTRISLRSKSNFQSSQKSVCRVAEWLNRAQGPEEPLFSRTIMLVL